MKSNYLVYGLLLGIMYCLLCNLIVELLDYFKQKRKEKEKEKK